MSILQPRIETLLRSSHTLLWGLAPILVLLGASLVVFLNPTSPGGIALVAIAEVTILLFILVLWRPIRFRWAGRVVAGIIFVATVSLLIADLSINRHQLGTSRGAASVFESLFLFLVLGIPCLRYASLGRVRHLQAPATSPS